jgi:hypothetical protein
LLGAGIYDFKLKGADGTFTTTPARFTYVYEKVNGTYKILTHHSSVLPETARLVFYKWNDALQTKDPKKVAAMYDAKGVLVGATGGVAAAPAGDLPASRRLRWTARAGLCARGKRQLEPCCIACVYVTPAWPVLPRSCPPCPTRCAPPPS